MDRRSYVLCQEQTDDMNIRQPPLSLETISNLVLPLTNEQVHNIEFDVYQHQSKQPLLHDCDCLTKSSSWVYNKFLKARRREVYSGVNSLSVLKELGLNGRLEIVGIY